MKKNKIIILCNLLILFATAFFAYGVETVSPSVKAPKPPSIQGPDQLGAKAPSLPPVVQTPGNVYSYNPLGKPDPFKPFVDVQLASAKKEAKVESIFPLLRESVESFRLVGIAGDQIRRVAMVEDSAKKFYPIFIGTRIGLNNGKVTDILADRVAVDELDGKKVKRIILKLRKNI